MSDSTVRVVPNPIAEWDAKLQVPQEPLELVPCQGSQIASLALLPVMKVSDTKSELSKGLSDLALSHKSLENVFVFTASQQLVYYLISGLLRSIGQMVIH